MSRRDAIRRAHRRQREKPEITARPVGYDYDGEDQDDVEIIAGGTRRAPPDADFDIDAAPIASLFDDPEAM